MSSDLFVGDVGRDGSIYVPLPLNLPIHTVELGQASSGGLKRLAVVFCPLEPSA